MIEVKGKGGIVARVVCDSVSEAGVRLTTFEVEFHRYVLSEYNTHRQFSRNAASTRAIPILRMLEQICNEPAMPVYYGKNQSGMSAREELEPTARDKCESIIDEMLEFCVSKVKELSDLGLHKQHAGRYIEAWQKVKGVVSSTEWANFYWLRDDEAAQPEIAELARCMREAQEVSTPQVLKAGQYHLPYVDTSIVSGVQYYSVSGCTLNKDGLAVGGFIKSLTLEEALKVACARCAAVSYRGEDYGLEKCLQLYDRLVGSDKKHASALEHCASPMQPEYNPRSTLNTIAVNVPHCPETWEEGISHMDKQGSLFSGNLKGWRQHRKIIPNECYNNTAS